MSQPFTVQRVLRVALSREGRILSERLLTPGAGLSVGRGRRNTFVIPDAAAPRRLELIQPSQGGYLLHFDGRVRGVVSFGGRPTPLAVLGAQGAARLSSKGYSLALDSDTRGKLEILDYTVLFQLVVAPPVRADGATSFRPRLIEDDDPVFLGFLSSFTAAAAALMVLVFTTEPVSLAPPDQIPDRFTELVLNLQEPPAPVVEVAPTPPPRQPPPAEEAPCATPGACPGEVAEATPRERPRTHAELVEQTREASALLRRLATTGENRFGDTTADPFGDADSFGADLRETLQRVSSFEVADRGGRGFRAGSNEGREDARIEDLRRGGAGSTEVAQLVAKAPKARVHEDPPETIGKGDADGVRARLRGYTPDVKTCYERVLKENPNAGGRFAMVVSVSDGAVTAVAIEENGTGSRELASCAERKATRWTFDPEVTMDIDLLFSLTAE